MKKALIIILMMLMLTGCVPWNIKEATDPRLCDKGTVDYWVMWALNSNGFKDEVCAKALGEIQESPLNENEGL